MQWVFRGCDMLVTCWWCQVNAASFCFCVICVSTIPVHDSSNNIDCKRRSVSRERYAAIWRWVKGHERQPQEPRLWLWSTMSRPVTAQARPLKVHYIIWSCQSAIVNAMRMLNWCTSWIEVYWPVAKVIVCLESVIMCLTNDYVVLCYCFKSSASLMLVSLSLAYSVKCFFLWNLSVEWWIRGKLLVCGACSVQTLVLL